jgi:hypothetical protein
MVGCKTSPEVTVVVPTYGDYYLWLKTLNNDELLQEVEQQRKRQESYSSDADIHIMLLHSLPESPIYNPYEAKSILNELQLQYLQSRYNPTNLALITLLRDLLNEQLLTIQKQNDVMVQFKNNKKIVASLQKSVGKKDKTLLKNAKEIFELKKDVQILREQISQLQSIEKNISEHGT